MNGFHSGLIWLCTALLLAGCQTTSYGTAARYYFDQGQPAVKIPANAPSISNQYRVLSELQASHSREAEHLGLDVVEETGAPVLAATSGKVMRSFYNPAYGNQISVEHGVNKAGEKITTIYKHLDSRTVKAGDRVRRGQQIGTMGITGFLAQGFPHLHFEVWVKPKGQGSAHRDPNLFWVKGPGKVTCYERGRRYPSSPDKLTYPVACK